MRALYDPIGNNPSRRSRWVTSRDHNIEPAERPRAPRLNKNDAWLKKLQENTYQMQFRWHDPRTRCHPTWGYEVQRRELLGKWFGSSSPPAGTVFWSNGRRAVWDATAMTVDGNNVWSNWETVDTPNWDRRYHNYSFTEKRNFEFRVRARNARGRGPWSLPLKFSVNMNSTNDLVIYID